MTLDSPERVIERYLYGKIDSRRVTLGRLYDRYVALKEPVIASSPHSLTPITLMGVFTPILNDENEEPGVARVRFSWSDQTYIAFPKRNIRH